MHRRPAWPFGFTIGHTRRQHWNVQTFATTRDAKEFLVSRIVAESQREGVPLSEVERKILYFSETAWTLPDIEEVNDAFDREYNQAEYERKIRHPSRGWLPTCADRRGGIIDPVRDAITEAAGDRIGRRRRDHGNRFQGHYPITACGKR